MKRILVTGSRDWDKPITVNTELWTWYIQNFSRNVPTLISGHARGLDTIAEAFAKSQGWNIETYLPDWERYGKRAGMLRNREMVESGADVCFAFIKDRSRGATGCARLALDAGMELHVIRWSEWLV